SCTRSVELPGNKDDRLVIVIESQVKTLDPRFTTDSISAKVSRLVFTPLVSSDNEELRPENELAEEIVPDMTLLKDGEPLRYIVKLRKEVKFHDGNGLTAADVAYTYNSILDPAVGSPYRGDYAKKFSRVYPLQGDSGVVVFELKTPLATFRNDLAIGIVPARLEDNGDRFDGVYVGTGSFRFAGSPDGRFIFLERFDGFYGKKSSFRHISFIVVADEGARILSLLSGTADIVLNGITPAVAAILSGNPDLEVISGRSNLFTYLAFNLTLPVFEDKRVRQALMHAIPAEEIIENKFSGLAQRAAGLLPEFHWAYGSAKKYVYDPEKAGKLLDEAGYKRGADGVRFKAKLKVSNNRLRRAVAMDIAHHLGKIGIQVEVVSFELSTFLADVRKGNYEMTVLQL
ncbi:MAG: ABC transporter substrate-binding protein, partial [Deltaproteobacteria bacterium]|nr:ABC transporter substrate-binding protein [Deltaproteobacteria bacterium]